MNARLAPLLGGVLLVALAASACNGSGGAYSNPMSPSPTPSPSPSPTPSPVGATLTITIVAMNGGQSFSPNPSSIAAGQTVAFYNADSSVHHIVADDGCVRHGQPRPGCHQRGLHDGQAPGRSATTARFTRRWSAR